MLQQNKKKDKKIDFKYNLGIYFGLLKNYKWLFLGLIGIIIVLELSYVSDRFLFKVIIDSGTDFANNSLQKGDFVNTLFIILSVFLGFLIIKTIGKWFYINSVNYLDSGMILDLKIKYFNHLISLDHSFHVSHRTGSMISRLTRGAGSIERMSDVIVFNFAPLFIQLIIVFVSLIYFDWVPAVVVLVTMLVFISYSILMQKMQEPSSRKANNTEDIEKGTIADIFTNIDSIKYFGKEDSIKKKFLKLTLNTRTAFRDYWSYYRWLDAGQSLILGLGTLALIYFPLISFLDGKMTLGTLVFIYTIFGNLVSNMFGFVHGIRGFYRSMADFQDLFEYGKVQKEILDSVNSKKLIIKNGEVQFKEVGFNYGKRKIFENFNLKVSMNKKFALVGHSGCGKTTLVKLLYRMYDVNKGEILIDGQNIRNVKQESLRGEMSIVPQECVLFDDTIYNNIAFSNPRASRDEVFEAIKFAQLDKIIKNFPNKEETIVGERGVKLSGGEKQRVSIARAILADKKILVLDEATSSLDSETEHEIQQDLERLMKGRTSIIIAHRLSTIMKADTIVVMKNGKIVQMGNHNQLINQMGEYRHLWNLQKGGYMKE